MSHDQHWAETCILGDIIGEGGFATVYRATTKPSGHNVAVKRSRVSLKVQRTGLKHEARILRLLQDHPSVPRLIGYTRGPHFEYLAMELLSADLLSKVPARMALTPDTVASVGRQMLSALNYLHSQGLIHRDIKPENIMIGPDEADIRLIDFGLTCTFSATTAPAVRDPQIHKREVFGTVDWCSLNAHLGIDLRPRDDLESLAYVLCFLDRGSLPWRPSVYEYEEVIRAQARVKASKSEFHPETNGGTVRGACGRLLQHARGLSASDMPAYSTLYNEWLSFERRLGGMRSPDWTPIPCLPPRLRCWIALSQLLDHCSTRARGLHKSSGKFCFSLRIGPAFPSCARVTTSTFSWRRRSEPSLRRLVQMSIVSRQS